MYSPKKRMGAKVNYFTLFHRLFTSLSELEYLNVSSNKLEMIQEPPHSCPRLVCLLLHSNNLKEIPSFPLMPSVETLDLSCNDIQTMPQVSVHIHVHVHVHVHEHEVTLLHFVMPLVSKYGVRFSVLLCNSVHCVFDSVLL